MSVILTFVLVGLNLIALNWLLSGLSGARVDLTSEGLFSITPTTRRMLTDLDDNLQIYGYFSERTHPKLAPLIPEIRDLLDEYVAVSGGKVRVEILDPGSDESIADEAAERFGVNGTPFRLATKYESAIVNAYFALVVKYADQYVRYEFGDLIQIEPSPDGDFEVRLRNLEYDLTRAIKKVVYGFRSTAELFERIEQPVRLTAIWTPATLPELFAEVPEALRKAAVDLKEAGGDKFVFEEVDPGEDPALRQQTYERYGARPMSLGLFGGGEFYLYALLDVGGGIEQIPLTGEALTAAGIREAVENGLRRHTPGFLKTVGVAITAPLDIPPEIRMQMRMPPEPPPEFEELQRFLGQDYRVERVDLAQESGVPDGVDVLLVVKPKDLGPDAVFNLDQYLMRGGRVIICSGGYDVSFSGGGLDLTPLKSGLAEWLEHNGVGVSSTLVMDDRNQPLPIPQVRNTPIGPIRTWVLEPYPYLVQVRENGLMNPEITASLDAVGIYWGSPLTVDQEALGERKVIPILQSSEKSWTNDNLADVSRIDYAVPEEGTEPHLLAAAIAGRFKSYFAPPPDGKGPPQAAAESGDASRSLVLEESPETRLVVIGNAEFLNDLVARALSNVDGGFFTENLRFTQNLIDWVSLDNEMLEIRSRGMVSRRLDRIEPATQALVESLNYAVPVVVLIALGLGLYLRRRWTVPLSAPDIHRSLPAAPAASKEA